MSLNRRFVIFIFVIVFLCGTVASFAQEKREPELLPKPTEALNCSSVLRYIDDAVLRAGWEQSTLFVVVRAKDSKDAKLTALRAKYLKIYFHNFKITNVEVFGDIAAGRSNILDLYINGELTYSLPIRKRETLFFARC